MKVSATIADPSQSVPYVAVLRSGHDGNVPLVGSRLLPHGRVCGELCIPRKDRSDALLQYTVSYFARHTSRETYRLALISVSEVQSQVKENVSRRSDPCSPRLTLYKLDGLQVLRIFNQHARIKHSIEDAFDKVQVS